METKLLNLRMVLSIFHVTAVKYIYVTPIKSMNRRMCYNMGNKGAWK